MIGSPRTVRLQTVLIFLLYLIVSVFLQVLNGAYGNEFGGHPDEAGHYVTGLMVHDFLLSGEYTAPFEFAEQFYLHYPKVAFGHWPPFFYIIQAFWMILFTSSRTSLLLLVATISALLSVALYSQIKKVFSTELAVPLGLVLLVIPFIQRYSSMLMAEILLALLCFLAACAWSDYLQTERTKASVWFGVFSALAILTKGNGFLLCLLPVMSVFLSGRFDLLRRLSFWYPLPIVFVSCAPFTWLTLGMVKNGWSQQAITFDYFVSAVPYYLLELPMVLSPYIGLFALIGLVAKLRRDHSKTSDRLWAVHGALIFSVILFHCFVPSGLAARHLITAVPSLLLFFVAGIKMVCDQCSPRKQFTSQSILLLPVLLPLAYLILQPSFVKAWSGYKPLVDELRLMSERPHPVFLIASDPMGDGMFISAVAQKDPRPGCYALRSSKLLSSSKWDGSEYRLRFTDTAAVQSYLQQIPVAFLIIDKSVPKKHVREEQAQLLKLVNTYPDVYRLIGTYPMVRKDVRFEQALWLYQVYGVETSQPVSIEIDMRHMLDRTLSN